MRIFLEDKLPGVPNITLVSFIRMVIGWEQLAPYVGVSLAVEVVTEQRVFAIGGIIETRALDLV